mmetsp:Transcript_13725/g.41475  ORF Transcript_13725/g.41475 Transcript_13725/m.41475 type:complete len:339 (+) Transcript_13725:685-1701(+)
MEVVATMAVVATAAAGWATASGVGRGQAEGLPLGRRQPQLLCRGLLQPLLLPLRGCLTAAAPRCRVAGRPCTLKCHSTLSHPGERGGRGTQRLGAPHLHGVAPTTVLDSPAPASQLRSGRILKLQQPMASAPLSLPTLQQQLRRMPPPPRLEHALLSVKLMLKLRRRSEALPRRGRHLYQNEASPHGRHCLRVKHGRVRQLKQLPMWRHRASQWITAGRHPALTLDICHCPGQPTRRALSGGRERQWLQTQHRRALQSSTEETPARPIGAFLHARRCRCPEHRHLGPLRHQCGHNSSDRYRLRRAWTCGICPRVPGSPPQGQSGKMPSHLRRPIPQQL